jgi:hypothetical protein
LTQDDALYRFRLRAQALAQELGNVRPACRAIADPSIHVLPVESPGAPFGPEILSPRERGRPKMANQTSPSWSSGSWFGPARIAAELQPDKRGGIVLSPTGSTGCSAGTG